MQRKSHGHRHVTIPCHHMTMTFHHTITHTISPQDILRMFSEIIDLGQGVVVKVNCTGTDNHMSILKLVWQNSKKENVWRGGQGQDLVSQEAFDTAATASVGRHTEMLTTTQHESSQDKMRSLRVLGIQQTLEHFSTKHHSPELLFSKYSWISICRQSDSHKSQ